MTVTKDFIILGDAGFPFKINAASNKYHIVSKLLLNNGYHVRLFNKYNIIKNLDSPGGVHEGLEYEFLSGAKMRISLGSKVFGSILANVRLLQRMRQIAQNGNVRYLLISYSSYPMLLWVKGLSLMFGFKLILNVWEYHEAVVRGIRKKIDATLFYRHGYRWVDGVIVISSFLNSIASKANPKIPIVQIPALADFDDHSINATNKITPQDPYFLYCGGIDYKEAIDLVVTSFQHLGSVKLKLVLVVNGKEGKISRFQQQIKMNQNTKPSIQVLYHLPYSELLQLFRGASALLIPLSNKQSDVARFPQKLPEYLSTGRPVITTKVGDPGMILKHGQSALFADGFDPKSFAVQMEYVQTHPKEADRIGKEGKRVGRSQFHYTNVEKRLMDFLEEVAPNGRL